MDPLSISMMAVSVGMQFFNNYANNEKSREIQAKQREFQKAAANHEFNRMRKAQMEAARLALELEEEVHKERVKDIEQNYDSVLNNFAHSFVIADWPLNVLPFIMKGESFGSLFGGVTNSIRMHCVFTPSNCSWFNEYFYDDIDIRIESEMNNYWNTQSTHPIVYYGGGWNRRQVVKPDEKSIPLPMDLDDVPLLKYKLKDVPTMVIIPYFDPFLHFRVQLWGMGKDRDIPFRIDIPRGEDGSSKRYFSYNYKNDEKPALTDEFYNTSMAEIVPYIVCLIGFVADKYFWSMYGIRALLPRLLPLVADKKNVPYAKQLSLTYQGQYDRELKSYIKQDLFDPVKAIELCHSLKTNEEDNIRLIVSKYLQKNGYKFNEKYSLSENLQKSKLYIDDLIVLLKLSEYEYISQNTFTVLQKSIIADNFFYVLNISELFDRLYYEYSNFDSFVFVVKDRKVCVGFLIKDNCFKRAVVSILYHANQSANKLYQFNIKKKTCTVLKSKMKLFENIPTALFEDSDYNSIKEMSKYIENQIKLGKEIFSSESIMFDNAHNKKIYDQDIRQWVKDNSSYDKIIKIVRVIYEDRYYILLILTDAGDNVIKKESFKMHSVDKSIENMMKSNILLTINCKKNGFN